MQVKTFTIPAFEPGEAEAALNAFLRGHRVLKVEREFISQGTASAWVCWVEYMETGAGRGPEKAVGRAGRIDYKEVLNAEEFALFAQLRELRKRLAESAAIPAYTVFTNEQLAAMVRPPLRTKEDFLKIEGVGESRWEKYGARVMELLSHAKSEPPVTTDRRSGEPA